MPDQDLFRPAIFTRSNAERIAANLAPSYQKTVVESVIKVASRLGQFTPEDIRIWCEPPRGMENAFSSAILKAVDLKLIKPVRMTRAKRREAHGRKIPVYERAFELC